MAKDKVFTIFCGGGVIIFIIWGIINHFMIKEKFENPNILKKETVGVIVEFKPGARTASSFNYDFSVENKSYDGTYSIVNKLRQKPVSELKKYVGKKYMVWYVVDDPTYNKLLLNKPVETAKLK